MALDGDGQPWHPLTHSLKLWRANKHLGEVRLLVAEFLKEHGGVVHSEAELRGFLGKGYHDVFASMPLMPPPISLAVGDFLQNTKSALDHAVFYLCEANGGRDPKKLKKVYFPVFHDPKAYAQNRAVLIGGIPPGAQTVIDGLQPCQGIDPVHMIMAGADRTLREDRVLLAGLHDFAIIDRHRHLNLTHSSLGDPTINLRPAEGVKVQANTLLPASQVTVHFAVTTYVILSEANAQGPRTILLPEALEEVYRMAERVLLHLAPFDPLMPAQSPPPTG